jgi:hypothetical protein
VRDPPLVEEDTMISARKVDDEKDARRCLAAAERASMSPLE